MALPHHSMCTLSESPRQMNDWINVSSFRSHCLFLHRRCFRKHVCANKITLFCLVINLCCNNWMVSLQAVVSLSSQKSPQMYRSLYHVGSSPAFATILKGVVLALVTLDTQAKSCYEPDVHSGYTASTHILTLKSVCVKI